MTARGCTVEDGLVVVRLSADEALVLAEALGPDGAARDLRAAAAQAKAAEQDLLSRGREAWWEPS